jgi:mannose-1-phosphate guanylyltransferase
MIGGVRLFPHGAPVSARPLPHVWAFVLAGTSLRRGSAGFKRALDRAERLAPTHRIVTVLCRESVRQCASVLAGAPDVAKVVQPAYRGSAAELFLPALLVARRDPEALIVALHADEHTDGRIVPCLSSAIRAVGVRPDLTVLVGARPRTTRAGDGFVEPGLPMPGLEDLAVHAIRRFVYDSPRNLITTDLLAPAGLVAQARTLVMLGRRFIPDVLETLEPLEDVADTPEATILCEAVYECMPYASLSRELLERVPDVAVLPVPEAFVDAGEAVAHLAS